MNIQVRVCAYAYVDHVNVNNIILLHNMGYDGQTMTTIHS